MPGLYAARRSARSVARNSVAGRVCSSSVEDVRRSDRRAPRWRPAPASPAGRSGRATVRQVRSLASKTVHDRTSSQSWSSASIQKTATAGTPWSPRHLVGELQRRDRLEERVDRTAEEARLLAGQDGDGPRRRRAARPAAARLGGRAAAPLLLADGLGQLLAIVADAPACGRSPQPTRTRPIGSPAKNGARPANAKA